MNRLSAVVLLFLPLFFHVAAQSPSIAEYDATSQDSVTAFKPSLAVVIGILSIMFALTFILLIYAKFCHRAPAPVHGDEQNLQGLIRSRSQFSGIDKTAIESLPFFRFSSLKGSREGLECAVCLSKFEDTEILRLLPKCKHAFHIDCIDQWLEKHSSCPICRHKISTEDLTIYAYSNSLRFLWNQSELRQDSNLELFVQREENGHGSSRFSIGGSFRKTEKGNKDEESLIQEGGDGDEDQKRLHKFNHKIIVSDVVFKNRWSSVSSSDLMLLNSEMLNATSSGRFSSLDSNIAKFETETTIEDGQIMNIKEELERKRLFESKVNNINSSSLASFSGLPTTSDSGPNTSHTSRFLDPAERRSMSEITALSRFAHSSTKNRIREPSFPENDLKEERMRRLWLPIARRTVQWFANRERRPQESQNTRQPLDV
ncbi:hypothetical protein L1049_000776 [Liquidambar formosana]|uniref:RING-type E3 ubiquitin transferase n=1 Tax=Liquidambar formosana TaxID=63359 RepID=A0AAP0R5L9_LIQFO